MYIGIDWGGTKMEVIGLDAGGVELIRHRIPTPREDYDASIRAVVDLVALGERQITLDCDVLQADGGTRCASITGAWIALHDACAKLVADGKLPATVSPTSACTRPPPPPET